MIITKKKVLNILPILVVLAFFVTPLGYYGKVLLNRIFATEPTIIQSTNRNRITDYDWKLRDESSDYFNFKKSQGKVVFINFWATWQLPSVAQLNDIQELYDRYRDKVDFYIITDEENTPVVEFMEKNDYTFPITYQIIGESSPITLLKPSGSYILDKNGFIVVHQTAISDWDNKKVTTLLDSLLSE
ncbi:TlpA family protein disulfide reductase [Kriegella aquimaris]|uniref:Thiol-disulfide isomerase or thioredoxin n=1 Tax=Kriegella aquimaris TaxID=192904 RepID=A0A1G9UHB7_9FLAO|nr:TlpA disulfide reductase family protein [Kriegella aquimaris]SDM59327.1 Thiol-disulfide isomerase or thioredoxin [Kriegella aquimaris]